MGLDEKGAVTLPLLRFVPAHVASQAMRHRVLDPLLADLQFECARAGTLAGRMLARARGTLAFWQAFALSGVADLAGRVRATVRGGSRDEHEAVPRLLACIALSTLATSALILGEGWRELAVTGLLPALLGPMVPSVLVLGIPLGLLFGPILAVRRGAPCYHRGLFFSSILAGVITFALAAWVTPVANQDLRVRVWSALVPESSVRVAKGDRELTLVELSGQAAKLRAAGEIEEAARLDVEWHKKPVLGAFCLAMALCGTAITRVLRRRWARHVVALAVAAIAYALLWAGEQAADAGWLAPALGMWGPVALVAAVSGLALFRRSWPLESPARGEDAAW